MQKPLFPEQPTFGHPLLPDALSLLLNEGVGIKVNDSSGQGNNGTNNGATWVTGKSGPALSFDGVNDYVQLPSMTPFGTGDFTVSLQIALNPTQTTTFPIMIGQDAGGSAQWTFRLAASAISLRADSIAVTGTTDVLDSKLHLLTARRKGTTLSLFLDGNPEASIITPVTNLTSVLALEVGASQSQGRYLTGDISSTSIYTRALSAVEIKTLYDNPWAAWLKNNIALWVAAQGLAPVDTELFSFVQGAGGLLLPTSFIQAG